MDIEAKVREALKNHVEGVETLKAEDPLSSLGLDSLDLVEVVMDIEEAVGIQFEMEEITSFKTLGDVVNCIKQKI